LFDGLDELAPDPSKRAERLAEDFFGAVDNLVKEMNGEGRDVCAIVAGRSTVMSSGFSRLSAIRRRHLYEVVPYSLSDEDRKEFAEDPSDILAEDQRPSAW